MESFSDFFSVSISILNIPKRIWNLMKAIHANNKNSLDPIHSGSAVLVLLLYRFIIQWQPIASLEEEDECCCGSTYRSLLQAIPCKNWWAFPKFTGLHDLKLYDKFLWIQNETFRSSWQFGWCNHATVRVAVSLTTILWKQLANTFWPWYEEIPCSGGPKH